MPVLSARDLAKSYGTKTLFENLALTVRRGEKVGLLGRNGTGKSSLLRVLAGLEQADGGVVEIRREAKVLYLPQEPQLDDAKTALQHVLEVEPNHLEHEAVAMLSRLGLHERHHEREVAGFSGGERRRVALAMLLVQKPDLAILDEPTNHLDLETIDWLEDHLANTFQGAVLVVTHDRYVLDAIADRILELDRGQLSEFQGNYGDYLEAKALREEHEARVEQNRQNVLRRERAWLMRGAKARTTKQKARIQRAKALEAAGPTAQTTDLDLAELRSAAPRLGKTILEFQAVQLGVPALGEQPPRVLVRDLTLSMRAGERIGILGPNGAGKTTLLRAAMGLIEPQQGKVIRGLNTEMVLFDQMRAALEDDWSIYDNVAEREGAERTGGGEVDLGDRQMPLRQYLELFLFDPHAQRKKVSALSGGERARVALAKALRHGSNLLVLDEPTNDLDVETLGALEELLSSWPGVVLLVSHDRFFLDRVTTSILAFEEDGALVHQMGNYSDYVNALALRKEQEKQKEREQKKAQSQGPTGDKSQGPAVKPLTYGERIELAGMMDAIAAAEEKASQLEQELADPNIWSARAAEAAKLQPQLEAAQAEVLRLMERWEALETRQAASKR